MFSVHYGSIFSLGGSTHWSKITKTEHWNSWHYEM